MLKDTVLWFLDQILGITLTNSDSVVMTETPVICQGPHFADRRSLSLSMRRKRRRPPLLGPVYEPTRQCLTWCFLPVPSCLRENIWPHKKLHKPAPHFPRAWVYPGQTDSKARLVYSMDVIQGVRKTSQRWSPVTIIEPWPSSAGSWRRKQCNKMNGNRGHRSSPTSLPTPSTSPL